MRKVTIRQFHQNMWEEIKDLPLIVTRYGKPYLIVDVVPGGFKPNEISHKLERPSGGSGAAGEM